MLPIFNLGPAAIVTVVVSLLTIGWSITLRRKLIDRRVRFLVGFLGLLCACQGLRLLGDKGVWKIPVISSMEDAVDLTVALLYFGSLLVINLLNADHRNKAARLRLAEATEGFRIEQLAR